MATTGTEKYSRIALTLVKGGTKLTRKLLEKRIKDLNPPDKDLTIDEFLLKHETTILNKQTGKNKRLLYFPLSCTTDLEQWDLHMFCFILLETCALTPPLRMYVEKLQKIRNKLCHLNEPALDDGLYADYSDKLENCFKNCLAEINDPAFTTEIDELVKSFKSGPLALDDTIKQMYTVFRMELEVGEKLEKQSEKLDKHSEEHKEILDSLKRIEGRQTGMSVDVPGICIVIEVNCNKEKEVVDVLVKMFNEIMKKKESNGKEDLPNGALHNVREAIEETFMEFLQMGRRIVKVEQKCIMLTVKCESVTSFVNLVRDYSNGTLDRQLQRLQSAILSGFGCKDVELETVIYKDDFWSVVKSLVATLDEKVKPNEYTLQPFLTHSGITSASADSNGTRVNGFGDIHLARTNLPDVTTNSIRITISTTTPSHQKELEDYIETPLFQSGMKRIQTEIGHELNVADMSITAKFEKEADPKPGRSEGNENKTSDTNNKNVDVEDRTTVTDKEDPQFESTEAVASLSDLDFDLESPSHEGVMGIYELIGESFDEIFYGEGEHAKQLALKAASCIDLEKNKILEQSTSDHSDEQIADLYKECSRVLYMVKENIAATKCYYSAMVFDSNWNYDEHLYMSDMLWGKLVFFRWNSTVTEICQDVEPLLEDLDKLAQIAEEKMKWSVCVAISCDMETIYYFLNKLRRLRITPFDMDQPGLKAALWRQARCYLKMGLHVDVKKTCVRILCEACDYNDTVALEIWARSLFATNDFDLALGKCNLALKYCESKPDKERLELLLSEIKTKWEEKHSPHTKVPDPEWLEGTNVNKLHPQPIPQSSEKKKKHKRPKAKDRSEHRAHVFEKDSSVGDGSKDRNADMSKPDCRESSSCSSKKPNLISVATNRFNQLGTVPEILSDQTSSEAESDWESSSESSLSDGGEFDADPSIDINVFSDQNEMSFYEQSLGERRSQTFYQSLLESGVKLGRLYMKKFDDTNPKILKREKFYGDALSKDELKKMISQNPKKYVRCVIRFESPHEAYCTPVNSSNYKSIEISGRSKIGQVFNEDEVVVELLDRNEARKEARYKRHGMVIGILDRKRHKNTQHPVFLCTLDDMESHLVRPICKTVPKIQFKTKRQRDFKMKVYRYDASKKCLFEPQIIKINPADRGSFICIVAFIRWGERHIYPRGAVLKILPKVNSVTSGLQVLCLQYDVPNLYDTETTETVSKMLPVAGIDVKRQTSSREDLTDENIFTIDEAETKDLSYAISIVEVENGYKIGVHVSDVSATVRKDSSIDKEAKRRGTTFISGIAKERHMLPEPLSQDICSLLPNQVRQTISVFLYISSNGTLMQREESDFEIKQSYIKSKRHLTYEEAENLLSAEQDDPIKEDVKKLIHISSKMRQTRLRNASFALDMDFEVLNCTESISRKAQSMVEEILVMANKKITEKLRRCYQGSIPVLFAPPPSHEAVEEFLKKNQYTDILLKFQNKRIGSETPDFMECLKGQSANTVILSKSVWKLISSFPKQAAQYIGKDDIHPIQYTTYQFWRSIQNEVEYRCSGLLTNECYSSKSYTTFTSPIRSYMDLVVHRLINAAVFQKTKCPYAMEEVEDICVHINSVRTRARYFHKACMQLDLAVRLREQPVMLGAFVKKVSERNLTLCSPQLKHVLNTEYDLSFNLLDVAKRPDVLEDKGNDEYVRITWKKRLYDFHLSTFGPQERGDVELNPNKDMVSIPLREWARMLKHTVEQKTDELSRVIKHVHVSEMEMNRLDDVTTECLKTIDIRPYTKFSMKFKRGQILKTQFSAELNRGMLTPKPMLYNMTENVKFCLQHTDKPVLYLYRYATRTTCEQYKNVNEYLKRWVPIIMMESATGAVKNEESFCIGNVPVKFTEKGKGKFSLGLSQCEIRNIELSGTVSDDGVTEETACGKPSYDWLCLKTALPKPGETKIPNMQFEPIWVGHATIKKVIRNKDAEQGGKLTVYFSLRRKESKIHSSATKFNVEVLRKSEVDRRTESFIKMLPNLKDSLALSIALNKPIKEIDKSRKDIARSIEHDLYYDASNEDLRRRALPKNNAKQQEAINKALTSRFSLIQGRTGKTNTGIKLIYLFNKINEMMYKEGKSKKQVLFCGPSNKSVDLVATWMLNRMGNYRPNFVRVYGRSIEAIDFPVPGRTFQSKRSTRNQRAPPKLYSVALHHLIRQKGKKHADEINRMDRMFKGSNYAQMPVQVKKYVHLVREASINEIRRHDVILCTTAVGSNPKLLEAANVYQVIVDEAGMCPEPQCLVPIIATKAEQVVLIGDHNQLRPIIMCKEAASLGLDTSLFERYAKTKLSKNVRFTMLENQYRMNPSICAFPSKQFYDDKLKTKKGLWYGSRLEIWPRTGFEYHHHILVDVEGKEDTLTVSTEDGNEQSKSNAAEVDHVIKVYTYLMENVDKETIQILSQYNAQCSEIKGKLKGHGFDGENVSTIVSSQGGEWDYVIFSTVRSLPEYKIEKNPTIGWCKHNLGFITDKNQVNVAITRARKGLIIIGNTKLLECDSVWNNLIQYYKTCGSIMSAEQFPPKQQSKQSVGEKGYDPQGKNKDTDISYIGTSKSLRKRLRARRLRTYFPG